jgi:hypothetical protein
VKLAMLLILAFVAGSVATHAYENPTKVLSVSCVNADGTGQTIDATTGEVTPYEEEIVPDE